jgi:hypothetical protein
MSAAMASTSLLSKVMGTTTQGVSGLKVYGAASMKPIVVHAEIPGAFEGPVITEELHQEKPLPYLLQQNPWTSVLEPTIAVQERVAQEGGGLFLMGRDRLTGEAMVLAGPLTLINWQSHDEGWVENTQVITNFDTEKERRLLIEASELIKSGETRKMLEGLSLLDQFSNIEVIDWYVHCIELLCDRHIRDEEEKIGMVLIYLLRGLDKVDVDGLIMLFEKNENSLVKEAVVMALATPPSQQAENFLVAILQSSPDEKLREAAAESLRSQPGEESKRALQAYSAGDSVHTQGA